MSVNIVTDPLEIMQPLIEFDPDLVLLDLYMPQCNGLELAQIIRQLDKFVGTPIVFLSSEANLDKQLHAMSLGADDFLVKPIAPQHLILTLANRIHRHRVLCSLMVRDSLTGLLNHTAIKEQLNLDMARARRTNTPLSCAMIDIDHFKRVNDTYGHATGDRVLKNIARLLRQRLRETDVVGRYGGEEFTVIMSATDAAAAATVMNDIREDFSRLAHVSEGREFFITFSCGVADMSSTTEGGQLGEAADRALYEAKHTGRNKVVMARI